MSLSMQLLTDVVLATVEEEVDQPSGGASDLRGWVQKFVATFAGIVIGLAVFQGWTQGKGSKVWAAVGLSLLAIALVFTPVSFWSNEVGPGVAGWLEGIWNLSI